jgi:hypothetical protein
MKDGLDEERLHVSLASGFRAFLGSKKPVGVAFNKLRHCSSQPVSDAGIAVIDELLNRLSISVVI